MSEFQGVEEPDGGLEEVGVGQELSLGCWGWRHLTVWFWRKPPTPLLRTGLYVFPISHLLETLPRTLAGGWITG